MTGMHPQNRRFGYARVSTVGQTLDSQLEQLRGIGCTKIYREKVTGTHNDRRELLKRLCQVKLDGLKKARSGMRNHTAAAAFRHALAASARKIGCVDRETRWR